MTERESLYVFRLGEADDDLTPAFVVDGRDYPDDEAVRAAVGAARAALGDRRLIADFETSAVRPETPRSPLPSWPEWRARHLERGEPIGVRPRPEVQPTPAGWDDMSRWLEQSRAWLDAQLAAAAGAVPGARVRRTREAQAHRVGPGSVVLAEERYRTDCEYLAVPPAGADAGTVLGQVAGALRAGGWTVAAVEESPGYVTLPAERSGYTITAVWSRRNNAVRLTGASPVVDATTFEARGGAGGAAHV
ncbi:hypothetical protein ACQP1P_05190 [Dactylosporangium sp. CA-052675]|uniref:hypothetical protein n=1 Tax=Dactylosporangium sp. CA-052675 TaxID=3239927 RepID=UPI003D89F62E